MLRLYRLGPRLSKGKSIAAVSRALNPFDLRRTGRSLGGKGGSGRFADHSMHNVCFSPERTWFVQRRSSLLTQGDLKHGFPNR